LTSALLHQSFTHLLSNILLLVGLAGQMEMKHGSWRTLLLAALAAVGGNLFRSVGMGHRRAGMDHKGPAGCW